MISKMKRCLALAVAMTVTFAGTNALGGRNSASAETYDNGGNYWGLENSGSAETGNRILVDLNHPYLTMDGVTWIIPTAAASSSWRSPVCPPTPIPSRPGTAVWVRAILPDCTGRNWSLAGGTEQDETYGGQLDIRNNVVYNWRDRTTDGGARRLKATVKKVAFSEKRIYYYLYV